MSEASGTAKKLGVRAGSRVMVIGMPVKEAEPLLGELLDGVQVSGDADSPADIVLLFADDLDAVREGAVRAHERVAGGGRLWIAYRKGATRKGVSRAAGEPLHRDSLQRVLDEKGLVGVSLIAIDDIWSAMRVRAQ